MLGNISRIMALYDEFLQTERVIVNALSRTFHSMKSFQKITLQITWIGVIVSVVSETYVF